MASPARSEMIGRAAERATVHSVIQAVGEGAGRILLIEGEPGIGKSRLVAEAVERAIGQDMRVGLGLAIRLAAQVPYAAWVDAFRYASRAEELAPILEPIGPDARVLAALVPEVDARPATRLTSRGGFDSPSIVRAFQRAIEALATDRPTLLVIEDIQWLDPSSIDLLAVIGRQPPSGLALVVTARLAGLPTAVEELRATLMIQGALEHLALAPLSPDDAGDLIGRRAPGLDQDLLLRIVARAGGNPFFLLELAATSTPDAVPDTVAAALAERIRGGSHEALAVLRLTAIAASSGEAVPLGIIEAASALPGPVFMSAIHELVDGGVLTISDDSLSFRHALLAEAATANLLLPERRSLHRRIALAIDATAADWTTQADLAGRRARHWSDAGDPERALVASLDAATAARRAHAPRETLRHLERALLEWDRVDIDARPASPDLVTILDTASEAAIAAGERRAIALVERAISLVDEERNPERAGALYQRLWSHRWHFGEGQAAIDAVKKAAALGQAAGGPIEASALATEARALMLDNHLSAAIGPAVRAMHLAAIDGDQATFVGASITHAIARGFLGEPEAGLDQLFAARRGASDIGDPLLLTRTYVNANDLLCLEGRFDDAERDGLSGVAALRLLGAFGYAEVVQSSRIRALVWLGRWTEADSLLEAHEAPEEGNAAVERWIYRAHLALAKGRLDDAETALADGRRRSVETTGGGYDSGLSELEVRLALERGQFEAARTLADSAIARLAHQETKDLVAPVVAARLRVMAEAPASRTVLDEGGSKEMAARLVALIVTQAGAPALRRAWSAQAEAELAAFEGRATPDRWIEVADVWARMNALPHTLYPLRRAAETILATGRRQAAAEPLSRATAIAESLGEAIELVRLRDLSRRARLSGSRHRAEIIPGIPERITSREAEVLELLATGKTNVEIGHRLFVSEHTVAAHVSHLLGKLGARSRAEAVANAARRGFLK